jgi:hypothetical protein
VIGTIRSRCKRKLSRKDEESVAAEWKESGQIDESEAVSRKRPEKNRAK